MAVHEDLLIEILAQLEAKCLLKFKCVSKEWRNLIFEEALSSRRLPPLMSGLYYHADEDSGYASVLSGAINNRIHTNLDFLPYHPKWRILDCCDGLLLCQQSGCYWDTDSAAVGYTVCNPLTRTWCSLPPVHNGELIVRLLYDHRIPDDFKVIRFLRMKSQASYIEIQIYSSMTGKWIDSRLFLGGGEYLLTGTSAIFFKGALYIVAYPCHIVKYDIKQDRCELIKLPEELGSTPTGCLGHLEGRLYYADNDANEMQIWTLSNGKSKEWVLKNKISNQALAEQLHQTVEGSLHILAFHPDLEVLFIEVRGEILSYHLNSSRLDKFWTIKENTPLGRFRGCPFSPCLAASLPIERRESQM